jgi:peptidase M1-like protein
VLGRCLALLSVAAVIALDGTGLGAQSTSSPQPAVAAAATTPRSPRNASYAISARLDPASRTLKGDELLTWRNISSTPTRTLRFHLYYNAWRNSASTWMRERRLAGDASGTRRPETDWGWIEVTSVRVIGSGGDTTDLTQAFRMVAPDDGNAEDATVMELPLQTAVQPGQTVNLQIAWSSRVPRTFARTGVIGNDYFLAQWFPKIGVLESSGWNCHQFHAGTEFFADFGVYDVRLTVPNGWVVGATGTERSRRDEGDGTTTHHYYAEDVHDFAWTTSPAYVERSATFEHPRLPPVTIRLLLQPEHAGQAERHFAATRATLKYYGEWFGPYPYSQITVVDPAWQSGFDGMEYPTLITAGTRWLAPRRADEPEDVTVHEAGHQFWYGVVATNEFEHAWMDEGLNTFSTARVLEQFFTPVLSKRYFGGFIPWTFPDFPLIRSTDGNRLAGYRLSAQTDAQSTPSFRYWPATGGAITYNKTALWLNTLERLIGWDTLQRILSTYFTRYQFAHPGPREFFAVVNEVSGQDLTWFFDQVYRSSSGFDYGIDLFTSRPDTVRGYVGDGDRRRFERGAAARDRFHTVVVARRYEDGVFPVDVRVVFENGEEVRWRWTGAERWKMFEVDRPVRAAYAQVDPERVLLLDANYTNNSARLDAAAARSAARKWSLTWLIWLQDHLLTYGFFV